MISILRSTLFPAFLLTGLISGGCAHYEYDVVEPAALATRVVPKSSTSLSIAPIRYEAQAPSDQLVLVIYNDSADPIKLLGDDSFAVDPKGESHPIPTRTIAPGTSTKLIFPPVRPTLRQSNPSIGFGLGVGLGRNYGRNGFRQSGFGGDPYFYDNAPRYYRLEDDGTVYWNWTGDGTIVKVRLVFQAGDKPFHHDFTFRRVKV